MSTGNESKVEFVALTKAELEDMIREAALVAAKTAADTFDRAHRKEEKEKIDRRLHNTKLLLRNYHSMKENCENSVYEKTTENVDDMIEEIMGMKDEKVIIDSIRRSASRTMLMIEHIDKMLDVFRIYCSKYGEKEKRQYKVIKAMYISKQNVTVADLAKKFNVSKVTIYDDIKVAEERLSTLFFGIDGMKIF